MLENFYASRNNAWLGILLQRYTLLLFGVCMKYLKQEDDAKDAVQQVFLKAISELHKYKVDFFKSWIYMVAKNHCLMKIRDRQGKLPAELKEEMAGEDSFFSAELFSDKEKLLDALTTALGGLNERQKQCVALFYLEKKSYTQIATLTGFSMLQVKSYIQNGKRNLKLAVTKIMQDHG